MDHVALSIDKLYIDGQCGSKKFAGVIVVRFEKVSQVTPLYKDAIPMRDPLSVLFGPRISLF